MFSLEDDVVNKWEVDLRSRDEYFSLQVYFRTVCVDTARTKFRFLAFKKVGENV